MNDIPSDSRAKKKLVQRLQLRLLRSSMWSDAQRQDWMRMYKIYRRIQDGVALNDEYSIFLGYAFSMVEQINSKVTEPMLAMGVPFAVYPNQFGDGARADNFAQVCRDYYGKPNVQSALRKSKKEMIITGNRWEVDEWLHVKRPGKMWGKVDREVQVPLKDGAGNPFIRDGKPVMVKNVVKVDAEVPRDVTTHYGFHSRYPSVFNMYPEPDRPTIDSGEKTDMSWCVEDLGELALEDLCREMYVDPADGMTKPVYDFGDLLAAAGKQAQKRFERILEGRDPVEGDNYGPLITPNRDWSLQSDWGQQDKDTVYASERTVDRASSEDRDKIWVCRMYEAGEILTVAQGAHVIHRKRDPWHVPKLRVRIENYATDPEFIYGTGALAPIEDELGELNDIHSMSMDNFFSLIHRMLYIREDAIVSMEDFKPRARGKIRIAETVGDINKAVKDATQTNIVNEMLGAEAGVRGLIEKESSVLDNSASVRGGRPGKKTATEVNTVEVNTNTRFITMQAQALINEALRGLSMQELFEQFAFEKKSYRILREDGSTSYAQFNKDDIDTQGRGFNFLVEVDPTWGNTQAQRQDARDQFELGIEYEKLRVEMKDPTMPKANLAELYRDLLKKHGRRDLSKMLIMPNNEQTPGDEINIIMQGGTIRCQGDLMHHVQEHVLQAQSPALADAIKAGKAHPDTLKVLRLTIEEDLARLAAFVADPNSAAKEKLDKLGMAHPGAPK